jgi:hypothetical protein
MSGVEGNSVIKGDELNMRTRPRRQSREKNEGGRRVGHDKTRRPDRGEESREKNEDGRSTTRSRVPLSRDRVMQVTYALSI